MSLIAMCIIYSFYICSEICSAWSPHRQSNSGCIIEGGVLTQVQTHAMETLGPINLAVL